jgi:peptide/nickel transport system substrate-binding protein
MFSAMSREGVFGRGAGPMSERFETLLVRARGEFDTSRRREIYEEMQRLCATEASSIIPAYANHVDAHSTSLAHAEIIGSTYGMDGMRMAERWWFA